MVKMNDRVFNESNCISFSLSGIAKSSNDSNHRHKCQRRLKFTPHQFSLHNAQQLPDFPGNIPGSNVERFSFPIPVSSRFMMAIAFRAIVSRRSIERPDFGVAVRIRRFVPPAPLDRLE